MALKWSPDEGITQQPTKTRARDEGYLGEEVWPVGSDGGARFDRMGTIKLGGGIKKKSMCLLNKLFLWLVFGIN